MVREVFVAPSMGNTRIQRSGVLVQGVSEGDGSLRSFHFVELCPMLPLVVIYARPVSARESSEMLWI